MNPRLLTCAIALLALLTTPAPAAPVNVIGNPGITDGDTLRVAGTRVRIQGIDAPEREQSCTRPDGTTWQCGQEAARQLQGFIDGRAVSCVGDQTDRYGRLLAACSVGGIDVGKWMVIHGWAVAYRRYSEAYVGDENRARQQHTGIWSGTFEMPWMWRRENE